MDCINMVLLIVAAFFLRKIVQFFFPTHVVPEKLAILITGCDTGFGHRLAIRAKEYGFHVFATCFDKTSDGAEALKSIGCDVLGVDVTNQSIIDDALAVVEDCLKDKKMKLHAIVNNAGINVTSGPMEWNAPEMVEKVFNVNVMGMVRVTRTFLPFIRAAQGDRGLTTQEGVFSLKKMAFNSVSYLR